MKRSKLDYDNVIIKHIMADGSVRDSVEGYVVPFNEQTRYAFELIRDHALAKQAKLES